MMIVLCPVRVGFTIGLSLMVSIARLPDVWLRGCLCPRLSTCWYTWSIILMSVGFDHQVAGDFIHRRQASSVCVPPFLCTPFLQKFVHIVLVTPRLIWINGLRDLAVVLVDDVSKDARAQSSVRYQLALIIRCIYPIVLFLS
ncbi:hypothetical protein RND81_05G046300 [Saponaria officinalis]|uniref:Uncharacterized protein n=1 Tax=Saponaria officinalis TaxID=3572 RepID=A0AAW1KUC0_SAPOF